ncbi:helix-turn-helix domain-containing protein [Actinocorallia populi]|uniref:helix-turn-helix domain-containing protein n=1 Tax=Actinocorallia populi TaxID=2079200 RepID=UPI000D096234|nr:helix-turn-helix domain-containing protein [Actinocorallia populi]
MAVKARGVLYPVEQSRYVELTHHAPSAPLEPYVEHYWHVRWAVDGVFETKVLSHPNVHLGMEPEGVFVYGVHRGLFTRRLEGRDHTLGVKFRVGAFRAFCGAPVSALADHRVPAAGYFGPEADALGRTVQATADPAEAAALAEAFLLPRVPARPDPDALRAAGLVARFTTEPSLFRVSDAAASAGLSVRALQRLFSEYVGASPKWVLRRARLHEVAARADAAEPIDWPALATELGYADQSHLIRDFTASVGHSPTRYTRP